MIEISEIRCSLEHGATEAGCLECGMREATRLLHIGRADIAGIVLHRKSVDARKRSDVHYTLSVRIALADESAERGICARVHGRDARRARPIGRDAFCFPTPVGHAGASRPVVVGAGCAGLFAALTLAEAGLGPLLIERGDDAARRTESGERFN